MLVLRVVAAIAAVLLIVVVLWDAFETVVLPRRVSRRFRLARVYTRGAWGGWSAVARRIAAAPAREAFMAVYGPIALLALLAIWALLLITAYALLYWGLGSPLSVTGSAPARLGTDFYFSGTTFLTLGMGDVIPHAGPTRGVVVVEVGTGFGMLALVIGYLPILYQAFSRREARISLLDAHAGSPPSAGALLLRHPPKTRARRLTATLATWEDWAAELLETHLSYPLLAYYRSQHEDQSWVAALAVILDTCALTLACGNGLVQDDELAEQAAFTFAIARHAAVDLAQVFRTPQAHINFSDGRLPPAERDRLQRILESMGVPSSARNDAGTIERLDKLRALYEPYMEGLATYLLMSLPPWAPAPDALDDWQTTAEGITAPSVAALLSHRRIPAQEAVD